MSATPPRRQQTGRPRAARGLMTMGALAMAVIVPSIGSASAATLPLTGGRVGAGDAVVGQCDTDGVTVAYTTAWSTTLANYRLSNVTVSAIAAGCNGRTLRITVKSATGTSLWNGSGTVAGTSAGFAVPGNVAAASVAGWAVAFS